MCLLVLRLLLARKGLSAVLARSATWLDGFICLPLGVTEEPTTVTRTKCVLNVSCWLYIYIHFHQANDKRRLDPIQVIRSFAFQSAMK
jgi:hypothetical protein